MKALRMILYALLVVLLGTAAYIRLAPSDPNRWHTDPGTIAATPCTQLTVQSSNARVTCLHPDAPADLLARLDAIALAAPRTTRLAGDPDSGRITWISRSFLWSFADYTTAQATQTPQGTRLDIVARQRFGTYDWGVNAGRLGGWMAALTPPP